MPKLTGVRERRQRTGVKSGQFAVMIGCSRAQLVSVENGNRPASPELTNRIAAKLTDLGQPTTVGQLLPVDGTVPDEPPKQPKNEPTHPPRRQDEEQDKTAPARDGSAVA